jgi:hypothetical protein
LAIGVITHVRSLDPDHPWWLLTRGVDQANLMFWSQNSVLQRVHVPSPQVLNWERNVTQEAHAVNLKLCLKRWQAMILEDKQQRMVSYITDECRKAPWTPDLCLFHRDPRVRAWAIAWRRNRLFARRKCIAPGCGETFHRGHVIGCDYFGLLPDQARDEKWLGFALDVQATVSDDYMEEFDAEYQGVFSFMDVLLNKQMYDEFALICNLIEKAMNVNAGVTRLPGL